MKSFTLFTLVALFLISSKTNAALPAIWNENLTPAPLSRSLNTPIFLEKQIYLEPAPQGISAKIAWELPGGRGENVKIIDVEIGFNEKHEDLPQMFFNQGNFKWIDENHGSGVLGVLGGLLNEFGVTGIAHKASFGFAGFKEGAQDEVDQSYIDGILKAIRDSAALLEPGDVLVIEQHMNGPDSKRYTAVEYWDPIFEELKEVTEKGIHCVQAAGNGGSNFDDPVYNGKFDLTKRDSGCVMVGAGSIYSKDRLSFSNYGSRIDAFGFGELVTTTGYGDLFNGGSNKIYSQRFSGTSSATPIVAGAIALVSSIAEEKGIFVTPQKMRETLRVTGTPQGTSTASKRIGNLPDIVSMLHYLEVDQDIKR